MISWIFLWERGFLLFAFFGCMSLYLSTDFFFPWPFVAVHYYYHCKWMEYMYVGSSRFFQMKNCYFLKGTHAHLKPWAWQQLCDGTSSSGLGTCSFHVVPFALLLPPLGWKLKKGASTCCLFITQYGTAVVNHLLYSFRSTKAWRQIQFKALNRFEFEQVMPRNSIYVSILFS